MAKPVDKESVRVGFRARGDLRKKLEDEAVRRGGPRDPRGRGKGYSDIMRDALEAYLATDARKRFTVDQAAALWTLLESEKIDEELPKALLLLARAATRQPLLAPAVKAMADAVRAGVPAETVRKSRRDRRSNPRE